MNAVNNENSSHAPEEKPKLRRAVFEKTIGYMLAGFGLVAALAWNDAIQTLFNNFFGVQGSLIAKFGYAILITIIITLVSLRLGRDIGPSDPRN